MKLKYKKDIIYIVTYAILLVFALFNIDLILSALSYVLKLLMPFLIGCIIAYVLNILLNIVEHKILKKMKESKLKRACGLIITLFIVIGAIALIIGLIVPQLQNTVTIFIENLPQYQASAINRLEEMGVGQDTIDTVNNYLNDAKEILTNTVVNNRESIISSALGIASSVIATVTNLIIAIVFAIYLLAQKETLLRQFNKLMKAYMEPKHINTINNIGTDSNRIFGNFVSGQCLEALIIGTLCFIGMLILRLPYASTISVLVGFTALIPVFGALIGTAIGAILILMIDPIQAIIFVIFIIILQQFEGNLIYPKVVGKSVGLPGIWVLVAVTIGASVAGIIGMLLSVPICSICYSAIANTVNARLKEKEENEKIKRKLFRLKNNVD